jgi:2-polyprenyl-3-methyl-5-hydroxy-6-metoxy-1,4-benzoquinol methylase
VSSVKFPIAAGDIESVSRCFCCGRTDRFVDVTDVRVETTSFLTTSVCAACGLVIRRHRPTQSWFERMWAARAEWQKDKGGTPFNPKIEEQRHARYARTAGLLAGYGCGADLIDIGCGPATGLRAFAEAGFRAKGLEPDQTRARFVRVPDVEIVEATIEQYAPTAQGHFDVVTCQHSLEHFHDPNLVLAHIAQLTKQGGVVFIEVPDFFHSVTDWQDALYLAHHTNFIAETLERMAAQVGLERIGREYPPDDDGGSHLALVFRKGASILQPALDPPAGFVDHVQRAYRTGLVGAEAFSPVRFAVPYINDLSLTLKGDPTKVRATIRENQADRVATLADGVFRVTAG